jgi:heme exporter protein C
MNGNVGQAFQPDGGAFSIRLESLTYGWPNAISAFLTAGLLAAALLGILVLAPTEATMGHAQRILYVHVAVAWCALAGFLLMAVAGAAYLARRDLRWDHWAQAAAEVGWLACTLTLLTGSLWARAAWNVWWTWDPRLATTFVLWAIYAGCLIVRSSVDDAHRRARAGAVLAILGGLDLPLVVLATRWFRGIHPAAPQMEASMRVVLFLAAAGFSALFALLMVRRRAQLRLEDAIAALETRIDT